MTEQNSRVEVLLVDDSYLVRQSIKAMLEFEAGEFTVVGEAENGVEAVEKATKLHPDVILMDINMPDMDGIAACSKIMAECPTPVVIISVQGEQEYLRRAMKAGARDYLLKPFTCDELVGALRSAVAKGVNPLAVAPAPTPRKLGRVVTVFSTKGGVGKTTLVANLACSLGMAGKAKVAAVDLDLEFGVLATMMGVRPQSTIVDLCRLDTPITPDLVDRVVVKQGPGGVSILAAPPLPHLASEVDGDGRADRSRSYVVEIIEALRAHYDYVVIDTSASFREANLIALDKADVILMVTQPEITALETAAKGLDVLLDRLEYSKEKVRVVLNRSDVTCGLALSDIGECLGTSISYMVPSDNNAILTAANTGLPIVLKRARLPVGDAFMKLAAAIASGDKPEVPPMSVLKPAAAAGGRRLFGLL